MVAKTKSKAKKTAVANKSDKERRGDGRIVKRLFDRKKKWAAHDYSDGFENGIAWAEYDAEISEFEHLEEYVDGGGLEILTKCLSPRCELFEAVRPGMLFQINGNLSDFHLFWERSINPGDDVHVNATWVRGFAEGALSVWLKIKPKVKAAAAKAGVVV